MAENSIEIAETAKRKRGRPSTASLILKDPRYLASRGINRLSAEMVLSYVVDEQRAWQRIFTSDDDRVVLSALMFLTNMRDGKATQRVNVTSLNIGVDASQIETALSVARELRDALLAPQRDNTADITPELSHSGTMLRAIEGQERVVDACREG